jgi:glycosyltransferase involved in cell wall biosynthesis
VTVAQLTLTLNFGGLEVLVIQLAEQLQRRGIRSPIVALSEGTLVEEARSRGIETFTLGKRDGFDPRILWKVARLVRRHHIDVLHTHNFAPLIYGALAGRVAGARVINTRHGRATLSTLPFIWRLTDRAIAVSDDARREMLKHNTIPPERVRVILNGIDLAPYRQLDPTDNALRRELGIAAGTPIVGVVARLAPEKDHATLLRAFRTVRERGVAAELVIVGGGELEATLRTLCHELGIESAVHFLGFRKNIPQLVHGMDLFVLPSRMEGVSLTLLEAMAAGKPVIATRVGGNPEVVVDHETGYLVGPGGADSLAAAMTRLLSQPALASQFGRAGRERALSAFSADRMVDAYAAQYAEVLEGRAANRAWHPASAGR